MKTLSRISLLALVLSLAIFSNGCAGYRLGSVKPSIYSNINKIYVPTFENATLEPRVAVMTTNAVIKSLQADGTYQITDKDNADAVLVGKITRIERRQLRAARRDTLRTREMLLFMIVEWSLHDPVTDAKLDYREVQSIDDTARNNATNLRIRPGRVIGRTQIFLDPNFQLSERNALPLAAQDAARILTAQLTEGW
ncbi:MAG: LPS assembly lipoprotein LptE [Verrucomicrobiales bacterium]|nr:LPS assembly lipoprotein LptE [Verrucomicrobiales bacterium]